jgi:hypothetical protein
MLPKDSGREHVAWDCETDFKQSCGKFQMAVIIGVIITVMICQLLNEY